MVEKLGWQKSPSTLALSRAQKAKKIPNFAARLAPSSFSTFFLAAFELGRHELFALRRLITK